MAAPTPSTLPGRAMRTARSLSIFAATIGCLAFAGIARAHGVAESDQAFIEGATGINIAPYMYLGAKHMVTGYDHLLFLAGVVFFLYRMKDVGIYVTLFAIGHSLTLLFGTIFDIRANPYIVDAIIGLSVAYKAFDNLERGGLLTLDAVWVDRVDQVNRIVVGEAARQVEAVIEVSLNLQNLRLVRNCLAQLAQGNLAFWNEHDRGDSGGGGVGSG